MTFWHLGACACPQNAGIRRLALQKKARRTFKGECRTKARVWNRALKALLNHSRGFQTSVDCLLHFKRLLAAPLSTMPTGSATAQVPRAEEPARRGAGTLPVRGASLSLGPGNLQSPTALGPWPA